MLIQFLTFNVSQKHSGELEGELDFASNHFVCFSVKFKLFKIHRIDNIDTLLEGIKKIFTLVLLQQKPITRPNLCFLQNLNTHTLKMQHLYFRDL